MFSSMRFSIVSIPVVDQTLAKAFYVEKLGLQVVAEAPFGDAQWIQLGFDEGTATIALTTWFDDMPPGTLRGLVLDTDDFEAEHARLRSAGVDISDPDLQPWGRFAYFADPDGNRWSLHEATPP